MSKTIVILTGPPGVGKTTYASTCYPDYVRISQDEQGKKRHRQLFKRAIEESKNIVVDRLNHTREQRNRYLEPARTYGYRTVIVEMYDTFNACFERIISRADHPTIGQKDYETACKALNMYYREFEIVGEDEADEIINPLTVLETK